MSGFSDLVAAAQPALLGGGCNASGTEGRSWRWAFTVLDNSGAPVDLSSGYTFDCRILTAVDGSTVVAPTVTGGSGTFTISVTPSNSAGKANGAAHRRCVWTMTITETATSSQVQVWGPTNSNFMVVGE